MNGAMENGYRLVSALFLRLFGAIYLVAFTSIAVQVQGLIGSQGIHPLAVRLDQLALHTGPERYLQVPTLFWLDASDATITAVVILGCISAVLMLLGILGRPARVAAFVLYLSLFSACQPFLNFQWDTLLLETGFLAIFLSPNSRVVIWLFRWLLFRLRFMSGLSKLVSGDPPWRELTALDTYFEVQPLPNPIAWYMHQLPDWLLRVGTAGTLFVELVVPFMMFLPRRWRFVAAWLTILWQVLIILTSNHNWINFLTIALCLFLFDDRALRRVLPASLQARLDWQAPATDNPVKRYATGLLAVFIFSVGTLKLYELATHERIGGMAGSILRYTTVYSVVQQYHVFPTMTTRRIELEVLGSNDGVNWKPYRFKYKPDRLDERPPFVVPHQPRVDWQMWFVTLNRRHIPWFGHFLEALLEGSPTVSALLAHNPFPDAPPRYLRVDAYDYNFTNFEERRATGNWWKRTPLGPFTPLPWMQRLDDAAAPAPPAQ